MVFAGQRLTDAQAEIAAAPTAKKKFAILAEKATDTTGGVPIHTFHTLFLNSWINAGGAHYVQMEALVENIKNAV